MFKKTLFYNASWAFNKANRFVKKLASDVIITMLKKQQFTSSILQVCLKNVRVAQKLAPLAFIHAELAIK